MDEASIFLNALQKAAPEERAAYLEEACGADEALRRNVEMLLQAHVRAGDFLAQAPIAVGVTVDEPLSERPGTVIGPYKLIEQIGEGGMGAVWMAQQTAPVKRLVAVKLIKAGMDSRQVVARFEAERQALALMDHPNIAKVFDGGTTATGRPYFVMELVKGVPLTRYCDEHRLTPRERLELFIPVCQAIQHAHQKGIIHRDIKPSNVLVALYDGKPVPKVIDFGVAKTAGQQLTERTLVTGFGAVVGTLEYMSPEQAELNQLDIDTRSDIYSLGVLLYELLTGSTPLERKRLKHAALMEVLRLIREEEPPKPSTRLSTTDELPSVAVNRGVEPQKLSGLVRGELDWIIMRALEKDRNRRYETANGFAQDIRRYLADEPVQACPPSARYRLQKFLRRNKRLVLAVAVIFVLLCGGIIGTTLGLLQAQRLEERAQHEAWQAGQERDQANQERLAADQAREAERIQRKLVEERDHELRRNLYVAELNQAGQAAQFPFGLARAAELLSHWQGGQPDLRGWEWYYLFGLCHQDQLTIPGSPQGVYSIAWSPDGTRLATSSNPQGRPEVWDSVTGKRAVTLANERAGFYSHSVAWSPDGALLASNWIDEILVWDAVTGKERCTMKGPLGRNPQQVMALAWAPDSIHLASGTSDQMVTIWDVRTGKAALVLKGHSRAVRSVAWSHDGKLLASGEDDSGTIKVWDGNNGKEVATLKGPEGLVSSVEWSLDDKQLVSVCFTRGTATIWRPGTPEPPRQIGVPGCTFVSWSPNGTRLAVGRHSGLVQIVALGTGTDLPKTEATLRGHSSFIKSVAWSPDGTRLASAGADGSVKVWQADQRDQPLALREPRRYTAIVAWSPSCKRLASTGPGSAVNIWDPATGKTPFTLVGHTDVVRALSWNPAGTRLATASKDATIKVWDTATGKELRTLKARNTIDGRTYDLYAVSWSPDGTRLASGDGFGVATIWDPVTGDSKELFNPQNFIDPLNSVSWSPDGTRLACASNSGKVRILDRATGKSTILRAHEGVVHSVAWCPKGSRLASAGRDRTITIWDATTGEKLATCKGHTNWVISVAWHPDGTRLASAGLDDLKLWDAATGTELLSLQGPSSRGLPCSVDWSPDGLRLAAGLGDTTVVYDAVTGYQRAGASVRANKGVAPSAFSKP